VQSQPLRGRSGRTRRNESSEGGEGTEASGSDVESPSSDSEVRASASLFRKLLYINAYLRVIRRKYPEGKRPRVPSPRLERKRMTMYARILNCSIVINSLIVCMVCVSDFIRVHSCSLWLLPDVNAVESRGPMAPYRRIPKRPAVLRKE